MQRTEIKWFNARRKQSTANEKKITFRLKNDTPAQEQAYRNPSTDCTMDATKTKQEAESACNTSSALFSRRTKQMSNKNQFLVFDFMFNWKIEESLRQT